MGTNKVKIYKDIVCLECFSPHGGKWWYMGGDLQFMPVRVGDVRRLESGILHGTRRKVLAAKVRVQGRESLVAINMARSDMAALGARFELPADLALPYNTITYSPWPEYARKNPSALSIF